MIKISTFLTFILLLFSANTYSSEHYRFSEAESRVKGAEEVWYKTGVSTPSYIRFRNDFELKQENALIWLKQAFKLPPSLNFTLLKSITTDDQINHLVYELTYVENTIEFLRLTLHVKNGLVKSISGDFLNEVTISNGVALNAKSAVDQAVNAIGAVSYKWQNPEEEKWLRTVTQDPNATFYPSPKLVIISRNADYKKLDLRYAFKMNVYSDEPVASEDVFVDAENGEILFRNNRINEVDTPGIAHTAYSGVKQITSNLVINKFYLRESNRGIQTWDLNNSVDLSTAIDFVDEDNNWIYIQGDMDVYATDAHWGAEMTIDYLDATFNRNSIDDNGFLINSYVHYGESYSNARWDGLLGNMYYGDGSNNMTPFTTLDIVGHEIGHGLTQHTAGLIYANESGALNESFSDILGNCVENFGKPGSASWRIGEDMGSFIRDMSFPNAKDHPDTYQGDYWYSGTGDNGGVHINSGVQNFWFYLLSEGGNGRNDIGYSYDVNGIGIMNAALIAYRTLSIYLGPNSVYEDASFFSIIAAKDIFGACSAQHEATLEAWNAVGIENEYVDQTVAAFSADGVDYCNYPFTIDFANTSANGQSYNWDFGDGSSSTEMNPSHIYNKPGQFTVTLTVDGAGCGIDKVVKDNLIQISSIEAPIAMPVDIYKGDQAHLVAEPTNGEIHWFDDAAGTVLIGKGNTFQTPKLDVSRSYYLNSISEGSSHNLGASLQNSVGEYYNLNVGLIFTTYQDIVLESIKVDAKNDGVRTFVIKDNTGNTIFEKEATLVSGMQIVELNAEIPAGKDFEITYTGSSKNLWVSNVNDYPYNITGLVSITGNTMLLEDLYPYFFDWNVKEKDCESELSEVAVSVEDIKTVKKPPYNFYVDNNGNLTYFIDFFFKENTRVQFGLYGINGQLVTETEKEYNKGNSTEDVNSLLSLDSYPSGVYFITVKGGEIEKTEKIVNKGGSN